MSDPATQRGTLPLSPAWISLGIVIIGVLAGIGATYRDVADLRDRVRTLEGKASGQDVAFAELKVELRGISTTVNEVKGMLNNAAKPQIVYPSSYPAPMPQQGHGRQQ